MEQNFLKKKYTNLHTSPEAISAANRTEHKTGEKVSENPSERIENYLNRFTEILDRTDPEKRQMGIEALKKVLHKNLIINPDNIPLDYFLDQEQRAAEQQGHGRPEPTEDWEYSKTKEIIDGQVRSLDTWIDYLSSPDALYPDWAKYWAFRSMTQMGGYNKKEGKYSRRTENSSQPFPTLNIACFAKTISLVQQQVELQGLPKDSPEKIKKEKDLMYALNHDNDYRDLVSTENFSKLYTHALEQFSGMSWKHLENIAGKWKIYQQDSDPQELYDSLQGYPLEWCTATNIETARTQLQGGDFHVYYSQDEQGMSVIPRVAIRMTGDSISEIRGIEKDQNVDQFITPIIDEKLDEFGNEGKKYLKKSADMKHLTNITEKHRASVPLESVDLRFIYEMDNTINGFGYQTDPRIAEIRANRNVQSDLSVLYEIAVERIAMSETEITPETKLCVKNISPYDTSLIDLQNITDEIIYLNPDSYQKQISFINPCEIDWNQQIQISKNRESSKNSFTLNPETQKLNYETLGEPTILFKPEWIGEPRGEIFAEIISQYSDDYYIPGFEYQTYLAENHDKIPEQLKDGNYYFTPGSLRGGSDGDVGVPRGCWGSSDSLWHRNAGSTLRIDWFSNERIVLFRKSPETLKHD